jgi:hypothetical protein
VSVVSGAVLGVVSVAGLLPLPTRASPHPSPRPLPTGAQTQPAVVAHTAIQSTARRGDDAQTDILHDMWKLHAPTGENGELTHRCIDMATAGPCRGASPPTRKAALAESVLGRACGRLSSFDEHAPHTSRLHARQWCRRRVSVNLFPRSWKKNTSHCLWGEDWSVTMSRVQLRCSVLWASRLIVIETVPGVTQKALGRDLIGHPTDPILFIIHGPSHPCGPDLLPSCHLHAAPRGIVTVWLYEVSE